MKTILFSTQHPVPSIFLSISLSLLISFSGGQTFAESNKVDSLLTELKKATHDTTKIKIYNNLFLEYEFTDTLKAKKYVLLALKLSKKIISSPDEALAKAGKKGLADSYIRFGFFNEDKGNYKKALKYYNKSLKLYEELGTSSDDLSRTEGREALAKSGRKGMSDSYNNIGGIHRFQGNYPKALEYYQKSLKIKEELGEREGIAMTIGNIAGLNIKLKNYTKAIEHANKGLNIAKEIGALYIERGTYKLLFTAYEGLNNTDKALKYYKLYTEAKDSLFNEEKNKQITEMETRYQSEKKEQQIKLLNKDKKLQKQGVGVPYVLEFKIFREWIKPQIEELQRDIQHLEEQLRISKERLTRLRTGKPTFQDLEQPYRHRRQWVEAPEHSGIIRIKPIVVSGIDDAFKMVQRWTSYGKKVGVEFMQHDSQIRGDFARLVSIKMSYQIMRFPKQYLQLGLRKISIQDEYDVVQRLKTGYQIIPKGDNNS